MAVAATGILPEHVDTLEWWETHELEELDGKEDIQPCWSLGSMAGIRARRATKATFLTTIKPIIDVSLSIITCGSMIDLSRFFWLTLASRPTPSSSRRR